METTVINATEYRNVSLALLSESKTNPRRIFEDAALKELAESIRTQGVLSPLLVRPLTENGFEIVAGTIANATGIRVLKAIADAVPVRLMRRDLLFVLMQTSPPPVSHCENRALPLGIVPEKCSFSTHFSLNGSWVFELAAGFSLSRPCTAFRTPFSPRRGARLTPADRLMMDPF